MYWETAVSTCCPSVHSTTLVSGRSVVSVWNGLPSTLPLRTVEWRSLIGNSGFVTSVGFDSGGIVRSTRSLSGASGSFSSPAASSCAAVGWGTGVGASSSSFPPQAATVSAADTPTARATRTRMRCLLECFIAFPCRVF